MMPRAAWFASWSLAAWDLAQQGHVQGSELSPLHRLAAVQLCVATPGELQLLLRADTMDLVIAGWETQRAQYQRADLSGQAADRQTDGCLVITATGQDLGTGHRDPGTCCKPGARMDAPGTDGPS